MNSLITSSRQRIKLNHVYYNIFPINNIPSSASSLTEAILYTIFIDNKNYGISCADLVAQVNMIFPQYSMVDIQTKIQFLLKNGTLVTLTPVLRNWCLGGYGCSINSDQFPVSPGITISQNIDQNPLNTDLVLYLIGLAGGTRKISHKFNQLFIPYVQP